MYLCWVSEKYIINMYDQQICFWYISKDFNKAIQEYNMIATMMGIKY